MNPSPGGGSLAATFPPVRPANSRFLRGHIIRVREYFQNGERNRTNPAIRLKGHSARLPRGLLALDSPSSRQAPQAHIRPIMGIWETIKAALGRGTSAPPDARRLRAVDEVALSASIRALPVGERGWITLSEARALFSQMNAQYAFGEMDEEGKLRLAEFAAEREHRSIPEFMSVEGRVYFTRKAI